MKRSNITTLILAAIAISLLPSCGLLQKIDSYSMNKVGLRVGDLTSIVLGHRKSAQDTWDEIMRDVEERKKKNEQLMTSTKEAIIVTP